MTTRSRTSSSDSGAWAGLISITRKRYRLPSPSCSTRGKVSHCDRYSTLGWRRIGIFARPCTLKARSLRRWAGTPGSPPIIARPMSGTLGEVGVVEEVGFLHGHRAFIGQRPRNDLDLLRVVAQLGDVLRRDLVEIVATLHADPRLVQVRPQPVGDTRRDVIGPLALGHAQRLVPRLGPGEIRLVGVVLDRVIDRRDELVDVLLRGLLIERAIERGVVAPALFVDPGGASRSSVLSPTRRLSSTTCRSIL